MTKEAKTMIEKIGEQAIFKLAKENGWMGKVPSVLGTYQANLDLEWAVNYIRIKKIKATQAEGAI